MQHHRHAGLAGRLASDGRSITPHPDTARPDAQMVWFPVATSDGREVDALEGLLCLPTRTGAMRLASVPHIVEGLALGDEIAIAEWNGAPLARGELALALFGTIRVVAASGDDANREHTERDGARDWSWCARLIDDAAGGRGSCWFDAISEHAVAASVPRRVLADVFATLNTAASSNELRFEYVTPARHSS